MKAKIFSFLLLWFTFLSLKAQVVISNTTSSSNIVTCGQPVSFNITFTNTTGTDISGLSRQLTLPVGFNFAWDANTLPDGVTLSQPDNSSNKLNIDISNLPNATPLQINYSIQAGCMASIVQGQQITIVTQSGDNITGNATFDVIQGNNGSLIRDVTFEMVNGSPSSLWAYQAQTGQTFTRSYRVLNNSGTTYNGYVNFANTFQSALELEKVSVLYNGSTIDYTPSTPATGSLAHSFQITNLGPSSDIIITETLKVINCLDDAGSSIVRISNGCYTSEECNVLLDNQSINVLRISGTPHLQITDNETPFPVCFDNVNYKRKATFVNDGTAPAKNVYFSLSADDPYHVGANSTLIPVNTFKITINKLSGPIVYEGEAQLSQLFNNSINPYPIDNNLTTYPQKCYTDKVFAYIVNFPLSQDILKDESVTIEWEEYNCCPPQPDIKNPKEWNGNYFHTTKITPYYYEECPGPRLQADQYPVDPTPNLIKSREEEFIEAKETLYPFRPILPGVNRSVPKTSPSYPFSGDIENIEIENENFKGNYWGFNMNPSNSYVDVDVELEDGLTLFDPVPSGGASITSNDFYAVTLRDKNNTLTWTGSAVKKPSIDPTHSLTPGSNRDNQYNSDEDETLLPPGTNTKERWTFRFAISDLNAFTYTSSDLYDKFMAFMDGSHILYKVRGVCSNPSELESGFFTGMYLIVGDDNGACLDCRIPIAMAADSIHVPCPGCVTPGVVMGVTNLERTSLGDRDDNNDGVADIYEGYNNTDLRRRDFATLGDVIQAETPISFVDGDRSVPCGYTNSQLQQTDGIYIDQLYVESEKQDGVELISSRFEYGNGQSINLDVNAISNADPNDYIFQVSASQIGQGNAFNIGSLGKLVNEYKIIKNLTATTSEIQTITYRGGLTDRDNLPINNLIDCGNCQGICGTTCPSAGCALPDLTINNHNFVCEPSNAANFLFIPLIGDPYASVAGDFGDDNDLCTQQIVLGGRYYHPKKNAFPFEYRTYTDAINFNVPIPKGYSISKVNIVNDTWYYDALGNDNYSYDNINISNPTVVPGIKGTIFNYTAQYGPNQAHAPNGTSYTNASQPLHLGDERMDMHLEIDISPSECGATSSNAVYVPNVPGNEQFFPLFNSPTSIVYPFATLDFAGIDLNENIFSTYSRGYFVKPNTNLTLLNNGQNHIDITSMNSCFQIRLNNPLLNIPYLDAPDQNIPFGTIAKDTKYTFLSFENLPVGLSVVSVTETESGTVYTDGNNDGIFEINPIPGASFKDYQICVQYTNCATALNNYPFNVLYGWNCDDYSSLAGNVNNACFVGRSPYTVSSLPLSMVLTPSVATSNLCSAFDYSLNIRSEGNGDLSNFDISVTLPTGINFNGHAQITDNSVTPAVTTVITESPTVSNGTLTWSHVFPNNIKLGQNFTFDIQLTSSCDYQSGSIASSVTAETYCGPGNTITNNVTSLPKITIPNDAYDNLSTEIVCSPLYSDPSTTTITVKNIGTSSTKSSNTLSVTMPSGAVLVAGTTAGYAQVGQVVKWNLPIINAGVSNDFIVKYQIVNPTCGDYVFNASISSLPKLSCGTSGYCAIPKITPTQSCTTTVVTPVDVREASFICENTGGCVTLTSGYNNNINYSWYIKGQTTPIPDANGVSIQVCPTTTTTYVAQSTDPSGCIRKEEFPVEVGYVYTLKINPDPYICGDNSKVCVTLTALRDVTPGVIGMDYALKYDNSLFSLASTLADVQNSLGVIVKGNDPNVAINPKVDMYNDPVGANLEPNTGIVHLTIYYQAGTPLNTDFQGKGDVVTLCFNVIGNPQAGTFYEFKPWELQESYELFEKEPCYSTGMFSVVSDPDYRGVVKYMNTNNVLASYYVFNWGKFHFKFPNKNTDIYSGGDCSSTLSAHTVTDNIGQFNVSLAAGNGLKIIRDIDNNYTPSIGTGPTPNFNYMRYVNGFDAAYASKITTLRALGVNPETSTKSGSISNSNLQPTGLQMIAADVNMNQRIRANDITLMQERTVHIIPEFPQIWNYDINTNLPLGNGPSLDWRFIDKTSYDAGSQYKISSNYTRNLPNGNGTGFYRDKAPDVPMCLAMTPQCKNQNPEQYYAVLLGDVINVGSYDPNTGYISYTYPNYGDSKVKLAAQNPPSIAIDLGHAQYVGDNTYRIAVLHDMPSSDTLVSIDFGINYDEEKLSIVNVEKGTTFSTEEVSMVWNDYMKSELLLTSYTEGIMNNSAASYYLNIKKPSGGRILPKELGSMIGFLNGYEVDMKVDSTLSVTGVSDPLATPLHPFIKVVPNPARPDSKIEYAIMNGSETNKITILNILGQVVREYNGLPESGMIDFNTEDLPEGVYTCIAYGSYGFKLAEKFVITK